MKQCQYCGRENGDHATHCHECGTELDSKRTFESSSGLSRRNPTVALWLRVILGILAGLQLGLLALLNVLGQFLHVLLQDGFHIGPPPQPLYSPAWGSYLLFLFVTMCAYHMLVALGVWGRLSFRIGLILHLSFATFLVLCLCYTGIEAWVYFPILAGPIIWTSYAIQFKPFKSTV